jgi:hypothetical protein
MTVAQKVLADTTVRVWSASGDSRVGIATEFPAPEGAQKRYAIQLLNKPGLKLVRLSEDELNTEWLLAPRIDIRWMNLGSVWVRNEEHKFWNRPVAVDLRCEVTEVMGSGHVRYRMRRHAETSDGGWAEHHHVQRCFTFLTQYTRLWGQEVPKGEIPQEPLPFIARKAPGRPKKEKEIPKTAFDRLLDKDLISE